MAAAKDSRVMNENVCFMRSGWEKECRVWQRV